MSSTANITVNYESCHYFNGHEQQTVAISSNNAKQIITVVAILYNGQTFSFWSSMIKAGVKVTFVYFTGKYSISTVSKLRVNV